MVKHAEPDPDIPAKFDDLRARLDRDDIRFGIMQGDQSCMIFRRVEIDGGPEGVVPGCISSTGTVLLEAVDFGSSVAVRCPSSTTRMCSTPTSPLQDQPTPTGVP